MDSSIFQKSLDTAYRLLAGRPHTRAELRQKLSRRGADADTVAAVIEELAAKGYIDEGDMALRWAQALARDKLWGPLKISAYLAQKGLSREIIDTVQRRLWREEFDEADIAARALRKHFGDRQQEGLLRKKAAFLRSRGFGANVVYAVAKQPADDAW